MGFPPLGWEDPLEEEMATHSSILAWKIPWSEEPVVHKESNTTELATGETESTGSVVVANGLNCSLTGGISPIQGLNPYLVHHWQADSLPLRHQGSPRNQHFEYCRERERDTHTHTHGIAEA